jgi:tetratricopeptide (TPR) repeat protein
MKECLSCQRKIEDLRHICPHCGGKEFSGDALSMLDAMQKQSDARQHVDRGAELARQGRFAEAEKKLRQAIEINPLNATAHGNLGGVYLRRGMPEEAIPWLEKALELNPYLEGIPEALTQARAAAKRNAPVAEKPVVQEKRLGLLRRLFGRARKSESESSKISKTIAQMSSKTEARLGIKIEFAGDVQTVAKAKQLAPSREQSRDVQEKNQLGLSAYTRR